MVFWTRVPKKEENTEILPEDKCWLPDQKKVIAGTLA